MPTRFPPIARHVTPVGGSTIALVWGRGANGRAAGGFDSEVAYYMNVPRPVPTYTDVAEATGGFGFSMMRRTNGKVYSSGGGAIGQSGQGDGNTNYSWTEVPLPEAAKALSCGGAGTLVLLESGLCMAWGGNGEGCGGVGDRHWQWSPEYVETADGHRLGDGSAERPKIIQAFMGRSNALFLDANNNIWITGLREGEGAARQLFAARLSTVWPALAALDGNTVEIGGRTSINVARLKEGAYTGNNNLRTWGDNSFGQWGTGTASSPSVAEAMSLTLPSAAAHIPLLPSPCKTLGVGTYTVIAVLENGRALAWGRNYVGQAGIVTTPRFEPVLSPTDIGLAHVVGASSSSDKFTGLINESGRPASVVWTFDPVTGKRDAYTFGSNNEAELGNEQWIEEKDTPQLVAGGYHIVRASAAEDHLFAVASSGTPGATIVSAAPGASAGEVLLRWQDIQPSRTEAFRLEWRRNLKPPPFGGQGTGQVLARVLADPGNAGKFTLVEFTKLPVQGEAVLYGKGEHGENNFPVASIGMPINNSESKKAPGTIPAKAVLTERVQPTDPAFKAGAIRWRMSLAASAESPAPEEVNLNSGSQANPEKYSASISLAATATSYSALSLPPPKPWPFADSEMLFQLSSEFRQAKPLPASITPSGKEEVAVAFTPVAGGDGKQEPGWLFRWTRLEPYLTGGQGGTVLNTRGEWLPSPTKYTPPEGTKKGNWVYTRVGGVPAIGWAAQKASVGIEPKTSPIWSAGTTYAIGALVKEADEGKTYIALKATTGETPSTSPAAWELWYWQELPFKNWRNKWQTGTLYKLHDWVWKVREESKKEIFEGWVCRKETSTVEPEVGKSSATWEKVEVSLEIVRPAGWGDFAANTGAPMSVQLPLAPFQTGTGADPGSPENLRGEIVRVEIIGTYANPTETVPFGDPFGKTQVRCRPTGAKDVPANIKPPQMRNLGKLGPKGEVLRAAGVRPRTEDTLEVIPGTWVGEGSSDPELAITERKYQWCLHAAPEDAKAEEIIGPEGVGKRFVVKNYPEVEPAIGQCVRVVEWAVNGKGCANEGALSEKSREVKE